MGLNMLILKNVCLNLEQMDTLMILYGQGLLSSCLPSDPCFIFFICLPASMLKVEMLVSFRENNHYLLFISGFLGSLPLNRQVRHVVEELTLLLGPEGLCSVLSPTIVQGHGANK